MFTLAQPRAMRSLKAPATGPCPPWSAMGMGSAATMAETRSASSSGACAYMPWALPMAGAKQSTPVCRMKSSATSSERALAGLVGADAVLDALDGLDLAFDGGPERVRLGHDLGTQVAVLLDAQPRAVEEDGVPPLARQAVMTARSGQWSRWSATGHGQVAGHLAEHREQDAQPDRLHGLDRRLDDDGRVAPRPRRPGRPPCVRSLTMLMAATP